MCTMVRNSGPRLLEWIAFHRHFLGVEHFVLYDNNSTDGTEELLRKAGLLKAADGSANDIIRRGAGEW
jgi:hypothetical protein